MSFAALRALVVVGCAAIAGAAEPSPITPTRTITLFNGFGRSPSRVHDRAGGGRRSGAARDGASGNADLVPVGVPTEFSTFRIDWKHRDPQWKDVTGFRGRDDVEKPHGGWNRVEAICAGDRLTYFVNGTKVNEAFDSTFRDGRILVQSEGAEIFFRRLELQPLARN